MALNNVKEISIDNTKLEQAISAALADKTNPQLARTMINIFAESTMIVPVNFPQGTPAALIQKIVKGQVKKEEMPKMVPVFIKNADGNKFAPCFSSSEKVEAHIKKAQTNKQMLFPGYMKVPALQIIKMVMESPDNLEGVIINMGSDGVTINKKGLANAQIKKEVKMTREQFIGFARQQADNGFMPKKVFAEKGNFIKIIDDQRAQLVYDVYKMPYGDKLEYPYTIDDFGVMVLDVEEGITMVCIELPDKGPANTAMSSYVYYDEVNDDIRYFIIEKRPGDENNVLIEILKDGKREELATAPATGNEINTIMDIIRDDEE